MTRLEQRLLRLEARQPEPPPPARAAVWAFLDAQADATVEMLHVISLRLTAGEPLTRRQRDLVAWVEKTCPTA